MKISFKKEPRETGLRAVGSGWRTQIKLNGKECGYISGGHYAMRSGEVSIRIAFVDEAESCKWKYCGIKNTCKTEKEAREVVKTFLAKDDLKQVHTFEASND